MRLLLCLVLLLAAGRALGQNFRLGLQVAPQLTRLANSQDEGEGWRLAQTSGGFAAGASVEWRFRPRLAAELNILYSLHNQSYRQRDPLTGAFEPADVQLDLLKLPLFLVYNAKPNDRGAAWRAGIGPVLTLVMGTEELLRGSPLNFAGTQMDLREKYGSSDIGLGAFISYEMPISKSFVFQGGLRADIGFRDLENKGARWIPDGATDFEPYYEGYFPSGATRTAPLRQASLAAFIGIVYIVNTTRDPNDYYY